MRCYFDTDVAKEAGSAEAAIVFAYIQSFTQSAEKQHDKGSFKKGKYWCCISIREFVDMYKCFSTNTIRTALDRLEKQGLIEKAHFDASKMSNVTWYAITAEGRGLAGKTWGDRNECQVKDEENEKGDDSILEDIANQDGAQELFLVMTAPPICMDATIAAKLLKDAGNVNLVQGCITRTFTAITEGKKKNDPIRYVDSYLETAIRRGIQKARKADDVSQKLAALHAEKHASQQQADDDEMNEDYATNSLVDQWATD